MFTDRSLTGDDLALISAVIATDEYNTRPAEFFTAPGSVANIYSDDTGPAVVIRGVKSLRLDAQFLTGDDDRNRAALIEGVSRLAQKARENGFAEIIFNTDDQSLAELAREFGFSEQDGAFRKAL